jgi:type IV secretion system protein VirD4
MPAPPSADDRADAHRQGRGTIIPNLLDYPGSVVCIDPKGENARITARHRARFGSVHVLDPFGVTGIARPRSTH